MRLIYYKYIIFNKFQKYIILNILYVIKKNIRINYIIFIPALFFIYDFIP